MKKKLGMILGAALLAIPAVSLAATYDYVNVNGQLSTVNADTAAQALLVSDIAPHSGVMLVTTANTAPTTITPTTISTGVPVTGTATSTSSLSTTTSTTNATPGAVCTQPSSPTVTTVTTNPDGSYTITTQPATTTTTTTSAC